MYTIACVLSKFLCSFLLFLLQIQPNSNLPSKICSNCKQQVISIYTFKQKSKRIEKSLKAMFTQNEQPATSVKQENIIAITDSESLPERIICDICDTYWNNEEEFYEHLQVDHAGEINVETASVEENEAQQIIEFTVDDDDADTGDENMVIIESTQLQPAIMSRPRKLSYPQIQQNPQKSAIMKVRPINSPTKEPKSKVKVLNINPAEKSAPEKRSRSVNEEDEMPALEYDDSSLEQSLDEYECYICALTYIDKQEYLEHCKTHDFYCNICCKVFIDENELREHRNEHKESPDDQDDLFCGPCNKRLRSSAQVEQHTKMHESMSLIINYIEFFPCHDCTLIFVNNERLQEHFAADHKAEAQKAKKAKLKKIDETCTDYQFLEEEKEEEYQDGAYSCGHCAATYSSATGLKYHVILHSNKFSCPIFECGCEYDQLSRLSIHVLNKHINMSNLQCLHCNDSFSSYDELQSHLRNDCKEKKFNCPECGKYLQAVVVLQQIEFY